MLQERTGAHFQTTRWTLVAALKSGEEGVRRKAMEEVMRAYWPAVYAGFRRRGCRRDEAAELTQAFFVEVVLGRGLLERASAEEGTLRSLLRTALGNFHIDGVRRRKLCKEVLPLQERLIEREEEIARTSVASDPADAFDRRWALTVLEEALRRCEQYYVAQGMARNWEAYAARVVTPACSCVEPRPLKKLAEELGWKTPQDVAAAVQTVKRRLLLILEEVATELSLPGQGGRGDFELVLEIFRGD